MVLLAGCNPLLHPSQITSLVKQQRNQKEPKRTENTTPVLQAGCPRPGQHRGAQPGTAGGKLCRALSPSPTPIQGQGVLETFQSPSSPPPSPDPSRRAKPCSHGTWFGGSVLQYGAPAWCLKKRGPPSTLVRLASSLSCCLTHPSHSICSSSYSPNLISIPRELRKGRFFPNPASDPTSWLLVEVGSTQRSQTHLAKVSELEAGPRFLVSGQVLTIDGSRGGPYKHPSLLGHMQGHGGRVACPAGPCVGSRSVHVCGFPGAVVLRQVMGRSKKTLRRALLQMVERVDHRIKES